MELRRSLGSLTGLLAIVTVIQSVIPTSAAMAADPMSDVVATAPSSSVNPTFAAADLRPSRALAHEPVVISRDRDGAAELVALMGRTGRGGVGTVPAPEPTSTPDPPTDDDGVATSTASDTTAPADPEQSSPGEVVVALREIGAPEEPDDSIAPLERARSVLELPSLLEASRASDRALVVEQTPDDAFACHERAAQLPIEDPAGSYDRNLVAQMTHSLFRCVASVGGFADREAGWGDFEDLAQLVATEAVVVSYCESVGYQHFALSGNNPWGYGGLFQMGATEMRRFGFAGASKFDPVDNAYAAATYFMYMNRIGGGWGGWGPWAVVNTSFNDDVNNQVKVPVLARFVSTDPDHRGRRGADLPEWAIDPWSYEVPAWDGCPFTGRAWAPSRRL